MKNGTCPRCSSATVYARPNGLGFGNISSVFIYGGKRSMPSSTKAYVCTTCGFFEVYLADTGALAELTQSWQKVKA
jgi:hypothetical protein